MLGGNKKSKSQMVIKAVKEEKVEVELPRPLFRGFIGGDAFITKKGYRGLKLESLWVQNIFEAFKTDDPELAAIALQSSIADVTDRVIGGTYGSPYSIGDYGFFAEKQFGPQLKYLQEKVRLIADQTKVYLAGQEWERVEKKLLTISQYGNPDFVSTVVGDSFADLAIRQSAFQVAKVLMNAGIDPLVENSEGRDMFGTMKEQYHQISLQLREVQELKTQAAQKIMVPSAVEHILSEECRLLDSFHYLSEFGEDLKVNLQKRVKDIEVDKILQRRAQLRNEPFPAQKEWNIAQLAKAEKYVMEVEELKNYVLEKIKYHESHASAFRNLAKMLIANYNLIHKQPDPPAASIDGSQSLEGSGGTTTDASSTSKSVSKSASKASSHHSRGLSKISEKSRSVISLTGESATSGALQVGFVFMDDTSVLTEEGGQPSQIPKLPYIPNRLRNALIDGGGKHYRGKKSAAMERALSRSTNRTGSANYTEHAFSPRSGTAQSHVSEPHRSEHAATPTSAVALAVSPSRHNHSAHSVRSPAGSERPPTHNSSAASPSRGTQGTANSMRPSGSAGSLQMTGFSPRTGTADSGFGVATTPSEKIRRAEEQQEDEPLLSSKEDLYALLGVTAQDDNGSVNSAGNKSNNSGIAVSSAKLLAKSMKVQYAPLLGTLKETADTVIMYR